jgi:hypothetical protein
VSGERRCITCGDVAIEMTVVRAGDLGVCVGDDGRHETVELGLVDDLQPGDRVLVHAGVALGRAAR